MKKAILFFTLLGFLIPFSTAQETPSSSLLWEITGKKVKSPSYLFGTMHLIPKKDFLFPESLQEKVKSTEVLVMEIGGISEQMKALPLMMLDSGSLFDLFSKPQLDSLFSYTEEKLGYNEEQMRLSFSKMKPIVLIQLFSKDQFGEDPESYEMSLEQIAQKENMTIMGLETIEEQIGFLDNLSPEDQVNMVMETIRGNNDDAALNEALKLVEVYLSQDIDEIYNYISQSGMNSKEFEEEMVTKRNHNWIKPIQKIIRKNKAFIAVGAAHLGGPDGVIELLRKEGYTVTPVKL